MVDNSYFKLFSCCNAVKGFLRSIIYDLQRKEYYFIPNFLYEILSLYKGKSIAEIKDLYEEESHQIIDNSFQYLFDNELAFPCDYEELSQFPDINFNWESPNILDSFILDIDEISNHDYEEIFKSLSQLCARVVQLRFFDTVNICLINKLLQLINQNDIRSVELIVPFNQIISLDEWLKLIDENVKLTFICIYNSPESIVKYDKQATLMMIKENITSQQDCGKISKKLFTCNLKLFTESQNFNTCLNCKASIDANGEIKNCPSMTKSFGHYQNVSLIDIIQTPEFQKLWKIKKDDIEVCKDCEFRYMCTDCRAYIKNLNDIFSQPAKCTYNPYIAKWKEEDGYIPVEESLIALQLAQ